MHRQMELCSQKRDPQTYQIIGAAMEVHSTLGAGYLELVYQEALAIEFASRSISFRREIDLPVVYKGQQLQCKYRPDFICYESVLVELKALDRAGGAERAQLINYLRAAKLHRGLLLNFGSGQLQFERFVVGEPSSDDSAASVSLVQATEPLWSPLHELSPHKDTNFRP